MKLAETERAPARNLETCGFWNLILLFQSFALVAVAKPLARFALLREYQSSSTGAQAPKSRPELAQKAGLGHQLSRLWLCFRSEARQSLVHRFCFLIWLTCPLIHPHNFILLLFREYGCPVSPIIDRALDAGSGVERTSDFVFIG